MIKKASRNHPESAGVERVDHDGVTHVIEPQDIEVSQKERLEWYQNGQADEEDVILDKKKNIEVSHDDGGNPMSVNEKHRTNLPRPHQYSIERRLQEDREAGSTYDIISDASLEQATATAFAMISPHVLTSGNTSDQSIVRISKKTGVPIQNVISLEKIARANPDLAEKYAKLPAYVSKKQAGIPGVVDDDDAPGLEKESEPSTECECRNTKCRCPKGKCQCSNRGDKLSEKDLGQIGIESGLC